MEELKELLSGLRSRFIEIDAEEHDRVTSQISHFLIILASTLVEQAVAYGEEHEMTRRFAAGGFRDMTRIAESEPGMWTSILLSNPQAILERIADFKERLDQVAETIQADNEEAIWSFSKKGASTEKKCRSISVLDAIVPMIFLSMFPIRKASFLRFCKFYKGFHWSIFTSMKKIVKISTGFCS